MATKKKENLWQLLKRLDEEAGQFNSALHTANNMFDQASTRTKDLLDQHEKDLRKTIVKVRKALKVFAKKNKKKS